MTLMAPERVQALGARLGIAALVVSGSVSAVGVPVRQEWSCAPASSSSGSTQGVIRMDASVGQRTVLTGGVSLGLLNATPPAIGALRAMSGLTASQVARLFGVSRRAVNHWIAGKQMASVHEERLSTLLAFILRLEGSTPDERRAALLDSSNGVSLFHQLLGQVPAPATLQVNPLSPTEQF